MGAWGGSGRGGRRAELLRGSFHHDSPNPSTQTLKLSLPFQAKNDRSKPEGSKERKTSSLFPIALGSCLNRPRRSSSHSNQPSLNLLQAPLDSVNLSQQNVNGLREEVLGVVHPCRLDIVYRMPNENNRVSRGVQELLRLMKAFPLQLGMPPNPLSQNPKGGGRLDEGEEKREEGVIKNAQMK